MRKNRYFLRIVMFVIFYFIKINFYKNLLLITYINRNLDKRKRSIKIKLQTLQHYKGLI